MFIVQAADVIFGHFINSFMSAKCLSAKWFWSENGGTKSFIEPAPKKTCLSNFNSRQTSVFLTQDMEKSILGNAPSKPREQTPRCGKLVSLCH
jgi:hypothetical protein